VVGIRWRWRVSYDRYLTIHNHTRASLFGPVFWSHPKKSWAGAITGLFTFPFVLHDTLQPILPKKLTQSPPLRNVVHKPAYPLRPFWSDSDFLRRISGVLRPGEVVLVLGAPRSGCTTFPEVIADERGRYRLVCGYVPFRDA